jgi:DNA repair exonuclease SbcCD nuclease subunit
LRGLSRYETAPVDTIRGATRIALQNLVDLAISESAKFLLIAGDLYDGDWKDYSTGIFLSRELGRLGAHGIKVIFAAGNHDAESQITKSLVLPDNMIILGTSKPETVELPELNVVIHGQGFATQHITKNLVLEFPQGHPGKLNIGLLHTSLNGREGHGTYAPCTLSELTSKGYQYWALGHVHNAEEVCRDPWVVYPGCIQGRHIRETGSKGCRVVTVEDGEIVSAEPRGLDVFRWANVSVELTDVESMDELPQLVNNALRVVLEESAGKPVGVRVSFVGATPIAPQLSADFDELEQQVRAIAAGMGSDSLWVEKVLLMVDTKQLLADVMADEGPLGDLVRELLSRPPLIGEIQGLAQVVAELNSKLLPDAGPTRGGLDLASDELIERLVIEARQLLISRLMEVKE